MQLIIIYLSCKVILAKFVTFYMVDYRTTQKQSFSIVPVVASYILFTRFPFFVWAS